MSPKEPPSRTSSSPKDDSALFVGHVLIGKAGGPGAEGPALGLTDGPDLGLAGQGFDFTFATTKVGWVLVCVYAVNKGTGHDTFLSCKKSSSYRRSSRYPLRGEPPPSFTRITVGATIAVGTTISIAIDTISEAKTLEPRCSDRRSERRGQGRVGKSRR